MTDSVQLAMMAITGDIAAFEKLVLHESDKLYKIAYLHMQNKEDSLDIVQEATFQAFLAIQTLKEPAYFSTWLTKILIRTAYKALERQKRLVPLTDDTIQYILESTQAEVHAIDLSEALESLNTDYRNCISLYYFYDLPIKTIARVLGKPPSTIKTHLRRAKAELKNTLGEEYDAKRLI
ncbi:sigma-70 family RNA polymerase sigma factor [Lysinibacillus piscis]|uniref:DNA-directed RNA polymerase sigma-70 factor n=1 Tax=Lysinibacillus piscis TaxID=2518931 RepID=A0ABQ5NMM9_9BACI|nr:sigma-70 family RNA polymerase sigma factor [Lysinibacillus sp. KH24]GLC89549.1 DNA-directed RNA polymerase sigma-70 factor [Lysinibacillus sp. KH24]